MYKIRKLLCILLSICVLSGCSGKESDSIDYGPSEENKLVVYTSHKGEIWKPIVREFEERYGIWVDVYEGGTSELLEKIEEGGTGADVMFGGGIESLTAFKDSFLSYKVKGQEYISHKYISGEDFYTPFSSLPIVLVYNPKLVSYGEVSSWGDLLDEKFKGKIAFADPERSGSSFTALVTMLKALPGDDEEVLKAFAKNLDGKVSQSSGKALESVCDGEASVGISIEETAFKRISEDKELKVVYPKDGTSCVPDGTAIIKDCPHRENAELFVDFTVSKAVQKLLTDKLMRRSIRIDTTVNPPLAVLNKIKLIAYNAEKAGENRDILLSSWNFFLGGE